MNWIIGDVHGMLDELNQVLAQIDEIDPDAKLWFVGDFCDRGYDSKGVVDRIIGLGDKAKAVRGNHDDVFHCIIQGHATPYTDNQGPDAALECLAWFTNFGMFDTFASYGKDRDAVKLGMKGKYALKALVADIPEDHVEFYKNLPLTLETDDFFIVHAFVEPFTNLKTALEYETHRKNMIWGRFEKSQIQMKKNWGKTGYFGHTPTLTRYQSKTPVFGDQIALVDTGAVFGNCLSAVCHETQEVVASKHASDGLL
jgi:serine/threonine protein phosphatase 1